MTERLTIRALHDDIGITPDVPGYGVAFGPRSKAALFSKLTNKKAPALTNAHIQALADRWRVPVGHIRGVTEVETPRGSFDDDGRPSILYERHVADRNTDPPRRHRDAHPTLFGPPYGPGGYGAYSAQYDKLAAACAIDPEAAFRACSWGAFQVLGENAKALGYDSAYAMAKRLVISEAEHLESFARFVEKNNLVGKLRQCKRGDPKSCQPFVKAYNGEGYHQFSYDRKLAVAI